MKPLHVLFVLSLLLIGCSQQKPNEQPVISEEDGELELLEGQVNRIHDEVMPRMGEIYKLKNKLQALDSSRAATSEKKAEIKVAMQKLDSAYDGMMDWMHQYKPEDHKADQEAAREYLENEMEKINIVKDDMLGAIEKAKSVAGEQ